MYRFLFLKILIFAFLSQASLWSEDYVIRFNKGDTIFKISKEHNIPPEVILKINGIKDPKKIRPGTSIKLPIVHEIAENDTISSISRKYKVTKENILKYNSISNPEKLKIGAKLYIVADKSYYARKDEFESSENLAWPLSGRRERLTGKLYGAVIYGKAGDTIRSVSSGRVIWAGPYRGYGKMVIVKSDGNNLFIYAGNDMLHVKVGDRVIKNTPIGYLGSSSHDGAFKALFFIYKDSKALDPFTATRE